MLIPFSN